jgi:hypothetical protein
VFVDNHCASLLAGWARAGGGDQVLKVAELERAADRPVHEIVRLEPLAEELLAQGAPTARSLARFVGGFEERVGTAMERGAVALKSIAASRGGLWLFTESGQADRRRAFSTMDKAAQAARFEDPVLLPFLVRRAAELAATRQRRGRSGHGPAHPGHQRHPALPALSARSGPAAGPASCRPA